MFSEAFTYPKRDGWKPVIIAIVLMFLSILIIPLFILFGYFIQILGDTANGSDDPPAFDDWVGLLVQGAVGVVISFVYAIVPLILLFGFLLVVVGGDLATGDPGGASVAALLLAAIAGFFAMLLIAYLLPAALTNYATTGSIGAAFDFGTLRSYWTSPDYLIAILVGVGINVAFGIVSNILVATIVLIPLAFPIAVYGTLVAYRVWGSGFRTAAANRTGASSGPATA